MRIGFIVNNYPPHLGGLELHVQSLAAELVKRGHTVFVIALSDNPTPACNESGIHVLRVKKFLDVGGVFSLPTFASAYLIKNAIASAKLDIISVHTRFFPMSWLGVALSQSMHIPVIFTEHGSDFVSHDSALIAHIAKGVDLTLGRWALRHSRTLLGVSPAATSFIKKISGREATVFFNAVQPPSPDLPRHSPTNLVFVGRLVEGKGWQDFIDVAHKLKADNPDITATIIGDGPDIEKIRTQAPQWVHITGRLPHSETLELIAGATLINPTVLSEGFQTTVVETIVNGGRVVGYPEPASEALRNVGAPVRIVERANTDALYKATKKMISTPPPPLNENTISQWTWPARAEQYEQIIQGLCDVL